MTERMLMAFSGGLKSSAALSWLVANERAEVIALVLDLGQGGELGDVRDRVVAAGAARCHVIDAREAFARDVVLKALQAGVVDGGLAMGSALTQPSVATHLVDVARMEDCRTVAHGYAGQAATAFEAAVRARDAGLRIQAPPAPPAVAGTWSIDAHLWSRTLVCTGAGGACREPVDDLFIWTKGTDEAPDQPARLDVQIDRGVPVAINGVPMAFTELVESLTTIAGAHGVGRVDRLVSGPDGATERVLIEAPAADVLHRAYRALEPRTSGPALTRFRTVVAGQYADVIENGLWFTPLCEALDAFVASGQARVSGTVSLRLFKGDCRVVGCHAPAARGATEASQPLVTGR